MSRHWREPLDPDRHTDWMSTNEVGGRPAEAPRDPLIEAWVYVVEVDGFRFEFVSLEQARECRDYFDAAPGPTRSPDANPHEHYWQRWFERLPAGITAAPERARVRTALDRMLTEFDRNCPRDAPG